MRRIITIAIREYRAMVGTKAFLISIGLMPILMMGSILIPTVMKKFTNTEAQKIIVFDGTDRLFDQLVAASDLRTQDVQADKEQEDGKSDPFGDRAPYELEKADVLDEAARLKYSEQVRSGDLFAFVEIPADVMDAKTAEDATDVVFYSDDAALSDLRRWLERSLNQIIRINRLQDSGINPLLVQQAVIPVGIESMGLYEQGDGGTIIPAEETDELKTLLLPFGFMMLMFVVIMMAAQPMLESVMEEKSERIAEVLLGSVNTQQLMLGKLLGNVAGSLTVFTAYAIGAFCVAKFQGYGDMIPFEILPFFCLWQVLAVLFFSSIFLAIGASVNQLKEAQGFMMPVWMLLLSPMFVWMNVIREPNGPIAVGMSFFPGSAPMMMVLRMSTGAVIPLWQIVVSIGVMILATIMVIFAAGRIFQIGILWQGKTPKLSEMLKWLITNPLVGS